MHRKEKVIAPLVHKHLGVKTIIGHDVNTDLFGTFSGEIERQDDVLTTLQKKCLEGMEKYDCDLAIASEGSFGMHPWLFNMPVDDESILLMDKKYQLEIISSNRSVDTNFGGREVSTFEELKSFATLSRFPSHALIIRRDKSASDNVWKGIRHWSTLHKAFTNIQQQFGKVYAETDMRAMCNPTRMKIIGETAKQLITKVLSCCPNCHSPGYTITGAEFGLPCEICQTPTNSVKHEIYTCKQCQFTEIKPNKKGSLFENPMYCNICNP